ncbi:MAG: hypothetical protein ACC651_07145 [Candidatus Scalindua sp.]
MRIIWKVTGCVTNLYHPFIRYYDKDYFRQIEWILLYVVVVTGFSLGFSLPDGYMNISC